MTYPLHTHPLRVENGHIVCTVCGRDYDPDYELTEFHDCPSDDCPSNPTEAELNKGELT